MLSLLTEALSVLIQGTAIAAVALAILYFAGFGISALFLPRSFKAFEWLCMPIIGFAVIAVLSYQLLYLFSLNLNQALWTILGVCAALAIFAFVRKGRPSFDLHWAETRWWWVLAAGMFLACLLPLFRFGYLAPIGDNWDVEFYLPMADYLKTYSVTSAQLAPPNPVRDVALSVADRIPLPSTYFNGIVGLVVGRRAVETFPVLIALWRALSLLSAIILFRVTLKMPVNRVVLAAVLFGLNGILLWVTYNNFEMHVAALAVLPLSLALMFEWMGNLTRGPGMLTALLAAALFLIFNPAFMVWALAAAAFFLYQLLLQRERSTLLRETFLIGLLAVLFTVPVISRWQGIYRNFYMQAGTNIGLRRVVQVSEIYGLSFFRINPIFIGKRVGFALGSFLEVFEQLIAWLCVVVSGAHLLFELRQRRQGWGVWLSLVVPYACLLLALVFILHLQYGFFKAASLVYVVFVALFVEGFFSAAAWLGSLATRLKLPNPTPAQPAWLTVAFGVILSLVAFNAALEVEPRLMELGIFRPDVMQVRELERQLKPGASVYLSNSSRLTGIFMSALGYFLLDHPLLGNVDSGFGKLRNAQNGTLGDYGLFYIAENPRDNGYRAQPIWSNGFVKVSPRSEELVSHFNLNESSVGDTRKELRPHYPEITAQRPVTLTVDSESINQATNGSAHLSNVSHPLGLMLGSPVPQTVEINVAGQSDDLPIKPGLNLVTTRSVPLPATLVLSSVAETGVWVHSVEVLTGDRDRTEASLRADDSIVQVQVSVEDLNFRILLQSVGPSPQPVGWAVDVRGLAKQTHTGIHFGRCAFEAANSSHVELLVSLEKMSCTGSLEGLPMEFDQVGGDWGDGSYSIYLSAFDHNQELRTLEIATFEISGGRIERLTPFSIPMAVFTPLGSSQLP